MNEKYSELIKSSPPLFLPVGSIRGLLSLILTLLYVTLLIKGMIIPTELTQILGIILAFYFGSRFSDKK